MYDRFILFFGSHGEYIGIEHSLIFLSAIGAIIILGLLIAIALRITKDIRRMEKNSRKRTVDFMRETSKHNKKERKRLKF